MFRDIGKSQQEFLENDYFFSQKCMFKTRNEANILVSGEAELSSKGPQSFISISKPGSFLNLEKLRIKSDGRIFAEASLKPNSTVRFTVSAEDGRVEPGKPLQSLGRLGCEVNSNHFTGTADIDVVNGPLIRLSAMYKHNVNMSIGGEAQLNSHFDDKDLSSEVSDVSIGFSSTGLNWNFFGKTLDSFGAIRLGYLHTVSPNLSVGSQLDYKLKSNAQKITFGTKFKLESDSIIKAKLDSNAIITTSFVHSLSKHVKMTLCGEVNAHEWSADSHKFGVGLEFE